MAIRIYVGRLAYSTQENTIQELFEHYGPVTSVQIIKENGTGQSKGFAFVEMTNKQDADNAIKNLNESQVDGRTIIVNEARPMQPPRNAYQRGDRR